jgi:hypothetical protein
MKLIDECRLWWRLWSVRLAAVAATLSAILTAEPTLLLSLVDRLPEPWRTAIVPAVWVVVFGLPLLARLARQPGCGRGRAMASKRPAILPMEEPRHGKARLIALVGAAAAATTGTAAGGFCLASACDFEHPAAAMLTNRR